MFLDVDDLEDIGELETCIRKSSAVAVFLSAGYRHMAFDYDRGGMKLDIDIIESSFMPRLKGTIAVRPKRRYSRIRDRIPIMSEPPLMEAYSSASPELRAMTFWPFDQFFNQ